MPKKILTGVVTSDKPNKTITVAVERKYSHPVLKNIDKLKKDLFNFRFQRINSEIKDPSKIGQTKKTIARLKTILKGKLNA